MSSAPYSGASPYLSEEEMAAFTAEFQPAVSAQAMIARQGGAARSRGGWAGQDKPKYPASPMEKLRAKSAEDSGFLCPRCKEGQLRRIQGRNGAFWGGSSPTPLRLVRRYKAAEVAHG